MTGLNHHTGRLETIVDGELVDAARVLFNGVPEIRVSGSTILENGIYRGRDIERLKKLAMVAAYKKYSPGKIGKWMGKKDPVINVNYAEG